jgi:hypothetical protein
VANMSLPVRLSVFPHPYNTFLFDFCATVSVLWARKQVKISKTAFIKYEKIKVTQKSYFINGSLCPHIEPNTLVYI